MRTPRTQYLLLTGLILVGAAVVARDGEAQPRDRQERKEDRKERREERREERRDERADDRQAHREDIKDDWKEKRKAWREKREERRKEARDEAKKKWGDLVEKPAAREELRVHARRMARLDRIRFLAEASGKTDIVTRTDKAIERENTRHDARMAALKAEAAK